MHHEASRSKDVSKVVLLCCHQFVNPRGHIPRGVPPPGLSNLGWRVWGHTDLLGVAGGNIALLPFHILFSGTGQLGIPLPLPCICEPGKPAMRWQANTSWVAFSCQSTAMCPVVSKPLVTVPSAHYHTARARPWWQSRRTLHLAPCCITLEFLAPLVLSLSQGLWALLSVGAGVGLRFGWGSGLGMLHSAIMIPISVQVRHKQ